MNRIEQQAMRQVPDASENNEIKPLVASNDLSAPILTPVIFVATAGLAAGAVVGYVDAARHGYTPVDEPAAMLHQSAAGASACDLLETRRDCVLG